MGAHMGDRGWFRRWFNHSTDSAADTSTGESGDTATARTSATPSDLMENSKQLLANLLVHVRTRLELLSIELAIERKRVLRNVVAGAVTAVFAGMTMALGAVYVVAMYWNTPYRLVAVVWLMFAAFVVTLLAGVFLFQGLRVRSVLFSASLVELTRDAEALEKV